ncbi:MULTISPECIES: DUF1127 domain-containing protein [Roseobacteraceae]|uniref:YjiS-like domain-containing protein n=1 Tax=Pseudosulfitobacter pseudonitzschiae TaxID=1402135 RepID=A0A221K1H7_9RHOB|nr:MULTISPECIES: DUF1127 domain-containing protein [Roseobacteraceae]ASM72763.1 hypothetical protein SULPSESMR1_01955 [Pseudosulfitobacter pseudonitzschiae]
MHLLHGSIVDTSIVQAQHYAKFIARRTQTNIKHTSEAPKNMAYLNQTATTYSSLTERLLATTARILDAAAERQAKRAVYRKTFNELASLGDRDLADLGLHRSHIRRIATEAAYGDK